MKSVILLCVIVMLCLVRTNAFSFSRFRPVLSVLSASVSDFNNGLSPFSDSLDLSQQPLSVSAQSGQSFSGDLLIVPFYKPDMPKDVTDDASIATEMKKSIPSGLDENTVDMIGKILDEGSFKADPMSKYTTRVFSGSTPFKSLALVGLGPNPKDKKGKDLEVTSANRLGKLVSTISKDVKASSVGISMPSGVANAGLTQMFLGVSDASYNDNRYRKVPKDGFKPHPLSSITLLGCSDQVVSDAELTYKLTTMINSGVDFARDLVGAPSNSKTPIEIANLSKKLASDYNIECKVLGAKECEELGMGAYLGVQQGSKFPPQFVHMTYKPEGATINTPKVALVGKGLTFDSGGYNLKAGAGSMIELMKFDMGGCAAVLGTAKAIAQLRPKNVEVHFITALCENMISEDAMRPGDILVASNGKTIEVLNTDAEGRLTLADALVYADKLGVDTIVDLATLTGACIVGLGDKLAGLYTSDEALQSDLLEAAKRSNEGIWNMPLHPEYKEMIKGTLGDLKNIGGRAGGSITAALFLEEFVEKAKWAHIDMAGPVWDNASSKPTGYGVKMLVDYLLNVKSK